MPDQVLVSDDVWGPFSASQLTMIVVALALIALAATAYALYVSSRTRPPSPLTPSPPMDPPVAPLRPETSQDTRATQALIAVAVTPPHLDPRPGAVAALRLMGFEELRISVGEEFDPHLHKAVGTTEAAQPATGQTIIESVIRPGWTRDGVLVEPAEVVTRRQ
jgi:hypothetical protein